MSVEELPARRTSVTDDAIARIKEMIVSGELAPGERLPKEADLAAHLGLSRNSLREAVRALALVRILDTRQGDGTYVTSLEPGMLLDALSFVADLHHDRSVLALLEVRRILEGAATALAAERITPEQVERLRALIDEMSAYREPEEYVENDREFHRTIAAISGNAVLASLIDSLSGRTTRARVWRGVAEAGAIERTRTEHVAICDALAAGRPDMAQAWATIHVAGVEAWLAQIHPTSV